MPNSSMAARRIIPPEEPSRDMAKPTAESKSKKKNFKTIFFPVNLLHRKWAVQNLHYTVTLGGLCISYGQKDSWDHLGNQHELLIGKWFPGATTNQS